MTLSLSLAENLAKSAFYNAFVKSINTLLFYAIRQHTPQPFHGRGVSVPQSSGETIPQRVLLGDTTTMTNPLMP
mgnify:CR=1 FL=1